MADLRPGYVGLERLTAKLLGGSYSGIFVMRDQII